MKVAKKRRLEQRHRRARQRQLEMEAAVNEIQHCRFAMHMEFFGWGTVDEALQQRAHERAEQAVEEERAIWARFDRDEADWIRGEIARRDREANRERDEKRRLDNAAREAGRRYSRRYCAYPW